MKDRFWLDYVVYAIGIFAVLIILLAIISVFTPPDIDRFDGCIDPQLIAMSKYEYAYRCKDGTEIVSTIPPHKLREYLKKANDSSNNRN